MERAADVVIGATFDDSFDTVIDDAQERVEELGDELDDALGRSRSTGPDLSGLNRSLNDSLDATRAHRETLRAGAMDAVALGASLYGLTQPAIQFESAMADVAKVMGLEAGTAEYDAIADGIMRLSEEIPISAQGFASIVESAGQMGLAGEEALQFARDAARMGVAFDMTAEQAGNAMQAMRASLQLSQTEVLALGNTLNHVSNQAGVTAADLTDFMTTGGVQFAQGAGVAREELIALGSTLMEMDIPAGEAGTAMRNFFQTLTRGEHLEAGKADVLRSIGLDPEQIAAQISEGGPAAQAAVDQVLDQLSGVADAERAGVLSAVFGAYGVSTVSALINARDRLGELRDLASEDAGTSMIDEFETRAQTTEFAMQSLMNTISSLSITIGSVLLPALVDITDAVKPVIMTVTELAGAYPQVTQVVIGAAAAFAALKVATFAGGYAFSFVKEGALQAARAVTFTAAAVTGQNWTTMSGNVINVGQSFRNMAGGIRAAGLAMVANPIGLTVMAVAAAVGVAALAIRKYWEPLSNFFSGVWDGISSTLDAMSPAVDAALAPLKAAFEPIAPIFDAIGTAVGSVVQWFRDLLEPVTQTEDEMAATVDMGRQVGEVIGTVVVGAIQTLMAPIRLAIWGFTNLSEGLSNIYNWFTSLPERVSAFGTEILNVFNSEGLFAAGQAMIQGLWEGMRSMWDDVVNWITGRINALLDIMPDWVTDAMGIEKQARVLTDVEIDQQVSEQMEDFNEPRFNSRIVERDIADRAQERFADEERGFFGGFEREGAQAEYDAFIQNERELARIRHETAVEEARAAEAARIRAELVAANEEVRAEREAELAAAIGEPVTTQPLVSEEPVIEVVTDTPAIEVPSETLTSSVPRPVPRPEGLTTFEPTPEPTTADPMPVQVVQSPTQTEVQSPAPAPDASAEVEAAVAEVYRAGAETLSNAMAQAVALESARAAALAAERPRSITANVQAPITVNNYGPPDRGGAAVREGVSQGANDILAAERDQYVD